MSTFSREWLGLREPADAAARNASVANTMAARFAQRDSLSVVDLGCGTGANLRATAPLLPHQQSWRLIDSDPSLLEFARVSLESWADEAKTQGTQLQIRKGNATITVDFECIDLTSHLEKALSPASGNVPGLVTASAFFDLVSERFIQKLAGQCAQIKAAFYTVLTYNGVQRWNPHRPADNQIASAVHQHQLRDKGFGPAAGPMAASHLSDQFRLNGYLVTEGDSPWVLGRNDRMLIEELMHGQATAAAETGLVDAKTLESWVKVQRSGAQIGHTDTFAVPA